MRILNVKTGHFWQIAEKVFLGSKNCYSIKIMMIRLHLVTVSAYCKVISYSVSAKVRRSLREFLFRFKPIADNLRKTVVTIFGISSSNILKSDIFLVGLI